MRGAEGEGESPDEDERGAAEQAALQEAAARELGLGRGLRGHFERRIAEGADESEKWTWTWTWT